MPQRQALLCCGLPAVCSSRSCAAQLTGWPAICRMMEPCTPPIRVPPLHTLGSMTLVPCASRTKPVSCQALISLAIADSPHGCSKSLSFCTRACTARTQIGLELNGSAAARPHAPPPLRALWPLRCCLGLQHACPSDVSFPTSSRAVPGSRRSKKQGALLQGCLMRLAALAPRLRRSLVP